jgi:general secretion pathway protein I
MLVSTAAKRLRRPGLSLLEVLLSMAIFLFSLVAIAGLVDFGSARGQAAAMTNAGTRLAKSKMSEVEAGTIDVTIGGSGTFDSEADWNWSVDSQQTTVPNVYQVTVRVNRDFAGRNYEVSLQQMIFDPNLMGSGAPAQPPTPPSTSTSGGS